MRNKKEYTEVYKEKMACRREDRGNRLNVVHNKIIN